MAAAPVDPVARVLSTKTYFDVLQLPVPTWDALGRPSWPHADKVGAAFRRLSFALHPDRTSHDDAPRAFQILKRAKTTLDEPIERERYVKRYVEEKLSMPQNSTWAATGSASDRVRAQLEHDARVKELRKEEARERNEEVLEQVRRRRQLTEDKMNAAQALKRRRAADEDRRGDESDGEGATGLRAAPSAAMAAAVGADEDDADARALQAAKLKAKSSKPARKGFI
jgi:DnaJ family protein C protein 8